MIEFLTNIGCSDFGPSFFLAVGVICIVLITLIIGRLTALHWEHIEQEVANTRYFLKHEDDSVYWDNLLDRIFENEKNRFKYYA